MHRLLPSSLLLLLVSLTAPQLASPALADEAVPTLKVVAQRLSQALGGEKGGFKVLEKSKELDFVFHRTVRNSKSRKTVRAEHRFVRTGGGVRLRLDVRVSGKGGVDSASVVDGEASWVLTGGKRQDADTAALRSRLTEFAPERLFSVPLTLAVEGKEMLIDADLELQREEIDGEERLVLSGEGEDGGTTRIVLDAESYRPVEVAFRSLSGDLVYRYDDYREVSEGLVLPFVREFHRNGIRISRMEVRRLGLHVPTEGDLFDPAVTKLPALPKGK